MKKLMIAVLFGALCVPAFAEGPRGCSGDDCPVKPPKAEAVGKHHKKVKKEKDARAEEFKKARKAHKEQMKATEEKMEKLVEEYNKLKAGKKKDAKKAEIAEMVASIRDEQIKFKEEQLAKFQERLEQMKKSLDEEKSDKNKKAWVAEKTDAVIADEGDLDVLFGPKPGPRHMAPGPRNAPHMGPGPKEGPRPQGHGPALPPPPPAEEAPAE